MKKIKSLFCTILSLIMVTAFVACGKGKNSGSTSDSSLEKSVVSISIGEVKTDYFVGDVFVEGTLNVNYSDESTQIVPLKEDMTSGFDTATAGNKTVTVTYETKTTSYNITVQQKIEIPVEKNFDVQGSLLDKANWLGSDSKNIVIDDNGFLTFRKKSNNVVTYKEKGMSDGIIEFQLKVKINSDTTATVMFSNQSKNIGDYCYKEGSKVYVLEFSNTGKMFVKKWVNGVGTELKGAKTSASVPLSLATRFNTVKIDVLEENNEVNVKVYVGNKLLLDVKDSENPILGGGAVGYSYTGAGGMVLCGKDVDTTKYVEPEDLGINVYNSPNVALGEGTVDILADFANTWTGRERIFNTKVEDTGSVLFSTKDNPEEPLGGVGEYQGLYKNKIFGNSQLEYKFNVVSHGEWIMFWFRCVPESSTNVSIWGNKKTHENTNGYSVLIDATGKVQIHKWADGAQIWLNGEGAQLPGKVVKAMKDSKEEITLKMSIEEIQVSGRAAIEFRVSVNESDVIIVQDTEKTVFTNAGYVGVQGFSINNGESAIRINSAIAKSEIDL